MSARQTRPAHVDASRTHERAADAPQHAVYVVSAERYALWRVRGRRVVLRSLDRPAAFLDSAVSGEFAPDGWRF